MTDPCPQSPEADVYRASWETVTAWEALGRTQSVGESAIFVQAVGRLRRVLETLDRCKEVSA